MLCSVVVQNGREDVTLPHGRRPLGIAEDVRIAAVGGTAGREDESLPTRSSGPWCPRGRRCRRESCRWRSEDASVAAVKSSVAERTSLNTGASLVAERTSLMVTVVAPSAERTSLPPSSSVALTEDVVDPPSSSGGRGNRTSLPPSVKIRGSESDVALLAVVVQDGREDVTLPPSSSSWASLRTSELPPSEVPLMAERTNRCRRRRHVAESTSSCRRRSTCRWRSEDASVAGVKSSVAERTSLIAGSSSVAERTSLIVTVVAPSPRGRLLPPSSSVALTEYVVDPPSSSGGREEVKRLAPVYQNPSSAYRSARCRPGWPWG